MIITSFNINSTKNQARISQKESKSNALKMNYPVLSNIFIPKNLQVFQYFQYPLDGTNVFFGWENAIIDLISLKYTNISTIKSLILGTWFLDSSGQFIQFNYYNINIFLSVEVLKETNLFNINIENNSISLAYDISLAHNCRNFNFIFNKSNDLPFNLLVLNEAHKLTIDKDFFSLNDLAIILYQRKYRTPVNTYEYITKDDLYRIQYIIDQSPYFIKEENGIYSKSESPFGSFVESELTSNNIINAMIKSFPIGHCFYKSELKKIITEIYGIQFSEKEIVLHERVFYCDGRFGVRPNIQFKKSSIQNPICTSIDIMKNVIVRAFTEVLRPISVATLFSLIDGKKYLSEIESISIKVIDEHLHSKIRSFINFQPFICCQNKEYFIIPKECECDYFGYIYICLIRNFLIKYRSQIDKSSVLSKFNEIRFPIKKNESVFIQMIKEAPAKIVKYLGIPKLHSIISFVENEFIESFKSNENDGEIFKNVISSKFGENADKIDQLNRSSNDLSNDFRKKAKKKKILLDIIPDQQELKINEESEDDFENDSAISDLEKKLIRLAKKYYNPKILTYSTPNSFIDELIGQTTINRNGKEFVINNDSESIELVANELMISTRFVPNKEHKRFCYTGKAVNDSNSIIHNSLSNDDIYIEEPNGELNNDATNEKLYDENEKLNNEDLNSNQQLDIFSELAIFNNSSASEDEKSKKDNPYSYSESYSSSNSDVSDSYIGIDVELNKWYQPKLRNEKFGNFDAPLSIIQNKNRNLVIEPNEFVPKSILRINRQEAIKERLKAIHESKDHPMPTQQQVYSLFLEFGSGISIKEFVNYVFEIEGIIAGENQ